MLEELLIPFAIISTFLPIAFHLAWKILPNFVKKYLLKPLVNCLWHKPLRSKGVLFTLWLFYVLFVFGVIIHQLSGQITAKTIVLLVLFIGPIFVVKALLNYRQRRG